MASNFSDENRSGGSAPANNGRKSKKGNSGRFFLILIMIYMISSFMPSGVRVFRGVYHLFPRQRQESEVTKNVENDSKEKELPFAQIELLSAEVTDLTDTEEWKNGTLKETVPDLKKTEITDGFRLYQFDVKVYNKGTKSSRCDGQVFLTSKQGDADQQHHRFEPDSQEMDTCIIPPKREAIITIYGLVRTGTGEVYLRTYNTTSAPDSMLKVEMPKYTSL